MARAEFSKKTKQQALERSGMRCEAIGCEKVIFRRCFCSMHYSRVLRTGSTENSSRRAIANNEGLEWLTKNASYVGEECLVFPFSRSKEGYGRVTYKGKRIGAHRAMCFIAHGQPPTVKHEAAHSCGKGHIGCVSPNHLRWATRSENIEDREKHGAGNKGEKHGNSKLLISDVFSIKAKVKNGETQASVASEYGIAQSTVSKICLGARWGWADG